MTILPKALRRLAPAFARDNVHLRALALGLGVIPPRTMHSEDDARTLLGAVGDARRVVEIGVYEGASAAAIMAALGAGAELHLIDPFGEHADALPAGWGERVGNPASARASRPRARRRGARAALASRPLARRRRALVAGGGCGVHRRRSLRGGLRARLAGLEDVYPDRGRVVFHDARAGAPGGRGLPGPTAVVTRYLRGAGTPGWEITAEADRTVVASRTG